MSYPLKGVCTTRKARYVLRLKRERNLILNLCLTLLRDRKFAKCYAGGEEYQKIDMYNGVHAVPRPLRFKDRCRLEYISFLG